MATKRFRVTCERTIDDRWCGWASTFTATIYRQTAGECSEEHEGFGRTEEEALCNAHEAIRVQFRFERRRRRSA